MNGSRRLVRLPAQGKVAGVCAGFAEYFGADVTMVRLLWVILTFVPGCILGGVVVYFAACLIMPTVDGPSTLDNRPRLTRSRSDRKIAGVCGGIAEHVGLDSTMVRLVWVVLTIVPGAIVFGVFAYLVAWFIVPDQAPRPMAHAPSAP